MVATSLPSKSAIGTSETTKEGIKASITSVAAWWGMHDAGAVSAELDEEFGNIAALQDLTINGTTTTIWTDRDQWFTPDAAQNYARALAGAADSLCALDNLTNGGLLIVFQVNIGNNPGSGQDTAFHYGSNGSGGQYTIQFGHGANSNFKVEIQNVGGSAVNKSINVTASIGEDITCAVFFDVANSNIELFAVTSSSVSLTMPSDGTALPGTTMTEANRRMGIFCRPTTPDRLLGSSGSAIVMRDLFAIRFEDDQSAIIADIVQGFITNPAELPWALENK